MIWFLAIASWVYPGLAFASGPSETPQMRDGIAGGLLATPALEGGGPWFMPAVRVSAPLGSTHGVDLELGRIFGGSGKYAEIKRFAGGQLRFAREPGSPGSSVRYWLAGLRYTDRKKRDAQGTFLRRDPDISVLVGHGWKQRLRSGACVLSELGFAGGEGMMVYATIGVQWGPPKNAGT